MVDGVGGHDTAVVAMATGAPMATPYKMSLDNQRVAKWSEAEVFPSYNGTEVWKVKLGISPEQLSEILSQEARTEALIENVRTVAKCGNALPSLAIPITGVSPAPPATPPPTIAS